MKFILEPEQVNSKPVRGGRWNQTPAILSPKWRAVLQTEWRISNRGIICFISHTTGIRLFGGPR